MTSAGHELPFLAVEKRHGGCLVGRGKFKVYLGNQKGVGSIHKLVKALN